MPIPKDLTIDLADLRPSNIKCVDFQAEAPSASLVGSKKADDLKITGVLGTGSSAAAGLNIVEVDRPAHAHDWVPAKLRFLNLFESDKGQLTIDLPKPTNWVSIALAAHRGVDKEYFGPNTPTYAFVSFQDSAGKSQSADLLDSAPQKGRNPVKTHTYWGKDLARIEVDAMFGAGIYVYQICYAT